uniref:Reverse transcriptase domain, reverse transcriptase zinc-binding domain protein n=1 Tax=Tanacetum cinerariifolium TaxID=118510 RepID=A0A6L2KWS5_TANCI|nr:reverse transcriptase domain, reverse transcriptase zinc-binding domain protein [Tanacetum cinerariifolium]
MSLRGLDVPSIACPVCQLGVETTDHLFFSYSFATDIFTKILVWWELPVIGFSTYQEWLSGFEGLKIKREVKDYLEELGEI